MNSILNIIGQTGLLVQLVLLTLILFSVLSWAIIYIKHKQFKVVNKQNSDFLTLFWNSQNMDDIYDKSESFTLSTAAVVFRSGMKELKKIPADKLKSLSDQVIQNVQRSLFRASQQEIYLLEKYVSVLATTASAAPFIGLFGTVWGIIMRLNIAQTGNASLAIVAPGISEALIATAVGLGAAIPSVVAYNMYINKIKKVILDVDCFNQDFINIIQRNIMSGNSSS